MQAIKPPGIERLMQAIERVLAVKLTLARRQLTLVAKVILTVKLTPAEKTSARGKMDAHRKIKAGGETDGEMDARESRWKCEEKPPEGQTNARA